MSTCLVTALLSMSQPNFFSMAPTKCWLFVESSFLLACSAVVCSLGTCRTCADSVPSARAVAPLSVHSTVADCCSLQVTRIFEWCVGFTAGWRVKPGAWWPCPWHVFSHFAAECDMKGTSELCRFVSIGSLSCLGGCAQNGCFESCWYCQWQWQACAWHTS